MRVLLFAQLKDAAGRAAVELALPPAKGEFIANGNSPAGGCVNL
jgi:molybdopterin converting factor small subunit